MSVWMIGRMRGEPYTIAVSEKEAERERASLIIVSDFV
jgi:hypothetical protein